MGPRVGALAAVLAATVLTVAGQAGATQFGLGTTECDVDAAMAGTACRQAVWEQPIPADWGVPWDGSVVLGPDGTKIYTALGLFLPNETEHTLVVSQDTATGTVGWATPLVSPGALSERMNDFAVGGETAAVAGFVNDEQGAGWDDLFVTAIDTNAGAVRWTKRYDRAGVSDWAKAVAVSDDGSTVVTAGVEQALDEIGNGRVNAVLLAHDAATGEQRLLVHTLDVGRYDDVAISGDRIYAVGERMVDSFSLSSGQRVWRAELAGVSIDTRRVEVSPDAGSVVVTGFEGFGPGVPGKALTAAFDAESGAQRWRQRLDSSSGRPTVVEDVVVTNDGVFAAGWVYYDGADTDTLIAGFDLADGRRRFLVEDDGILFGADEFLGVDASPDGDTVVATGRSRSTQLCAVYWCLDTHREDALTVAYDAQTGMARWLARRSEQPVDGSWDYEAGTDVAVTATHAYVSMGDFDADDTVRKLTGVSSPIGLDTVPSDWRWQSATLAYDLAG
ncbi:MAG: PQQ-binding-like beta-propeller repeat protein [Actinobacteria bacterium]|nr:PQQ-binding-like beta-propeller repeat protein [Actinomycetota bacterium]